MIKLSQSHPVYDNDCRDCRFLGSMEVSGTIYDFYSCDAEYGRTNIARFGSKGPEYLSLPHFLKSLNKDIEPFSTFFKMKT
jgi:hypothetical protein